MAEMSNIDHAKLENRQIFFHGDIDGYASVAFILSSSLVFFSPEYLQVQNWLICNDLVWIVNNTTNNTIGIDIFITVTTGYNFIYVVDVWIKSASNINCFFDLNPFKTFSTITLAISSRLGVLQRYSWWIRNWKCAELIDHWIIRTLIDSWF